MIARFRQWLRDMRDPVVVINDQLFLLSDIIRRGNELAEAGDRLAHELMFRQHPEILARWWAARGGQCSACDTKHGDAKS